MRRVLEGDRADVCSREFVCEIHEAFYDRLPPHHQFTHGPQGFTRFTVNPGLFRDVDVSVDNGASTLGPHADELPERFEEFSRLYDPSRFHGDERLIAAAASHHRFTWLHPFRDGNGRVARLFSGLYLASIGINTSNLRDILTSPFRASNMVPPGFLIFLSRNREHDVPVGTGRQHMCAGPLAERHGPFLMAGRTDIS